MKKKMATILILFVMLMAVFLFVGCVTKSNIDVNDSTPDKIRLCYLGKSYSISGESVVFDIVRVVNNFQINNETVSPNDGYFLCLEGNVNLRNRSFQSDKIWLEFENIPITDGAVFGALRDEAIFGAFRKDITQSLSTNLNFDSEPKDIEGKICLVFEINEAQFQVLEENRGKDSRAFTWEISGAISGICLFTCLYSDVKFNS